MGVRQVECNSFEDNEQVVDGQFIDEGQVVGRSVRSNVSRNGAMASSSAREKLLALRESAQLEDS